MSRLSPENVFLGLLEAQSCHGYQLLDHFRQPSSLGHIWNLSTSQLYALLKKLENSELIDGREEETDCAPMRTVYWLTPRGRDQLNAWLNDEAPSASSRAVRTEFLSRVYIAQLLRRPLAPIIRAQREACRAYRQNLLAERDALPCGVGYLSIDLRLRETEIILDWIALVEKGCAQAQTP